MLSVKEIKESFLHLVFPHVCAGCGTDILEDESELCMRCFESMPETNFEIHPGNPVEKLFWGRLHITGGTAQFYFNKESLMQHLMHQFKYRGNKNLGFQLGLIMGEQLQKSARFKADALIPMPLFPIKEKRRGYNQSAVLCEGIKKSMHIPVLDQVICRPHHTTSQTNKGRIERWKNIEGKFELIRPEAIRNKHVLLIDDIITTGATVEACATELLKGENVKVSVAGFCISSR